MIRLTTTAVPVRTPDGARGFLDTDVLRADLRAASRAAGNDRVEVADNALTVLRRYARHRAAHGEPLAAEQVDGLVCRLLEDAGYVQVAERFARCRGLAAPPLPANLVPARRDALVELLGRDPFFATKDCGAMADKLAQALHDLGLTVASEAFLHELARLLWTRVEPPAPASSADDRTAWAIGAAELPHLLPPALDQRIRHGQASVRPVTRLCPRLELSMHLERCLDPGAACLELLVLPAVDELAGLLARATGELTDRLRRRDVLGPGEAIPVHLHCGRMDTFGDGAYRRGLQQEISAIIAEHFRNIPRLTVHFA